MEGSVSKSCFTFVPRCMPKGILLMMLPGKPIDPVVEGRSSETRSSGLLRFEGPSDKESKYFRLQFQRRHPLKRRRTRVEHITMAR